MMNRLSIAVIALLWAMTAASCHKEVVTPVAPTPADTAADLADLMEAVDLGLSVSWASCNVGARTPEEFGHYFAWGEVEPKAYYDWDTYRYCDSCYNALTKYCLQPKFGVVDGLERLECGDDAAGRRWGGRWRMPTPAETEELCDSCEWQWTQVAGVNGYRVTGRNGNAIFLPAAGYSHKDTVFNANGYGYYWQNTLFSTYSPDALCYSFFDGCYGNTYYSRNIGLTVRAVLPAGSVE